MKYECKICGIMQFEKQLDDDYLMEHPLIKHNASWRLDNLEDAVEVIIGLFSDYVGPVLH